MQLSLLGGDPLAELRSSLPNEFARWNPVHQAAYLEMVTLLEPYLLSIEGDRMGMAHSVEGRFPYLDHRLVEFATSLPVASKLRGLREKDILRRWADSVVPLAARGRPKRPYRAPDVRGFFAPKNGDYVAELLSGSAIASTGFFDREAVAGLVGRFQEGQVSDFAENQALVAILSTQLWFKEFCTTEATVQDPEFAPTDVCLEESVELV
jgi:asparagine synthase (glutamine-hydrolysing)